MKILFLIALVLGSALAMKSDWVQTRRALPTEELSIRLALPQQNLDVLERTLLDVSDPESPNYGQWWKPEKIQKLVSPPATLVKHVVEFLRTHQITNVVNFGDSIKVTAPAHQVEDLLHVELYVFTHQTQKGKKIIRAVNNYQIPSEIAREVDFIAGLYEFPKLRVQPKGDDGANNGFIIPSTLVQIYQLPTTFPVNKSASIGLAEFEGYQSWSYSDLANFTQETAIHPINVSHIVGPFDPSAPQPESTLDVEYGAAVALNTSIWYWTTSGWMWDFAAEVSAAKAVPLVISMSWGWPEPAQCAITACNSSTGENSFQYVERTNVEFQKIGLRGVTLVAASGDQGAPGDLNAGCSNGSLSTIFPGASPWVLSVGATMLNNVTNSTVNPSSKIPFCTEEPCANITGNYEVACSFPTALITSGGGFSNYVPQPAWQKTVVEAYLNSKVKLPPAKFFNASNRGFPDVAALGHNYMIYLEDYGGAIQVDGTSCSSPVFAAIIALLNSVRLNAGKAPLGYVIPAIYAAYAKDPTTFNDITVGNNACTEECCVAQGYECAPGWDPVTGLGTPNFPKLLKFVQSLP